MKELTYLLKAFSSLATWVKVFIVALLSTTAIGVSGFFGIRVAMVVALGILILALILAAYLLLVSWVRRRHAAETRGEYVSTAANRGIIDPLLRAKLDDMRRSFAQGIAKFKTAGKDLYDLPWYLVVGETGAGKTALIHHLEAGLPPDEPRSVGGTASINWWFTNYAVILDTQGRLMFEQSDPGSTSEWHEFLGLLRKLRFACPINGMLLTISVESLLLDPPEAMGHKAETIARQLEVIQRELGVRFPVFLLVTKCDLINGFCEFFADLEDPKALQQMLGWSNPAALEAPFRPEIIDEYLQTAVERLKRRRLGLLLNPAPTKPGGRRIDEVDRLYSFPQSLGALAPALRRYVERVFVARKWTSSPLFLRGIYFTSSKREGGTLDAELARAMGMPVQHLPAERVWEGGHAYFLRDLFLAKVFREGGLVTRATNTRGILFRTELLLFGIGVLGLLALLFSGATSYRSLQKSVRDQNGFWARACEGWSNGVWQPIVAPDSKTGTGFEYRGNHPIGLGLTAATRASFTQSDLTLAEFQAALGQLASAPMRIPWIFQPFTLITQDLDFERQKAQRVLFEDSVVKPLLDAARQKMGVAGPEFTKLDTRPVERVGALEAKALLALVRIEIAVLQRSGQPWDDAPGTAFLPPLLEYVADAHNFELLTETMNWTYTRNRDGFGKWAPSWTSGGSTLETNSAIRLGLDRLIASAQEQIETQRAAVQLVLQLAAAVRQYQAIETELSTRASIKDDPAISDQEVAALFDRLQIAKEALEEKLALVKGAGLFNDGPETLVLAYQELVGGKDSRFGQIFAILADVDRVLLGPNPNVSSAATLLDQTRQGDLKYTLLREIKGRLADISQQIKTQAQGAVTEQQAAEFKALDETCLDPVADDKAGYLARWNLYQECRAAASRFRYSDNVLLIGEAWKPLEQFMSALAALRSKVADYQGKMQGAFSITCDYLLRRAEETQIAVFSTNYLKQAKALLLARVRFPLLWPPGSNNLALSVEELRQAKALLESIRRDLQSNAFVKMPASVRQPLADFANRLVPLFALSDAILRPDNSLSTVSITLLNGEAQRQLSGPIFALPSAAAPTPPPPAGSWLDRLLAKETPSSAPPLGPSFDPRDWNAVELLSAGGVRQPGLVRLDAPSDTLLGKFQIDEAFRFRVFHTPTGGASETVDCGANWSALRLLGRFGGKSFGAGQTWRVSLKPGEPTAVWVQLDFETPLPALEAWPTMDSLGLRDVADPEPFSGTLFLPKQWSIFAGSNH